MVIDLGDCLELVKDIENNSIDCIIIDIPYFNQGTQLKYTRAGKKDVVTDFGEWDKFESDEEYLAFAKKVIIEMCRILKENGSFYCFTNDRYISYLRHFIREIENMSYASTIVWHKYNSPPRFIKAGFISSKELIMFAYKGKNPIFYKPKEFKEMLDVWITSQTPSNERLGHPTQKPISLIKKMIECSSDKGNLIFDGFIGSGTTAIACIQTERNFLGFEINPEYYKMAQERLKPYLEQKKLF